MERAAPFPPFMDNERTIMIMGVGRRLILIKDLLFIARTSGIFYINQS